MIVDSHVHLMPDRLGRAIRSFFERHIDDQLAYPSDASVVLDRHGQAGASAVWNLPYAHKPGMADDLNAGMAEVAAAHAGHDVRLVTGCTVHPGDIDPAGSSDPRNLMTSRGQLFCSARTPATQIELFQHTAPGATTTVFGDASGPDHPRLGIRDGATPVLGGTVTVEGAGPANHVGVLFVGASRLPLRAPRCARAR